ncbi:MAG: outer membrane beta-barrel protein [Rhodospirillaceae bacterium]|jgi:opacity protein-like surface antigen|nr:outer membrane beta-barrel protein [Rhodospirillaceae bacterium]
MKRLLSIILLAGMASVAQAEGLYVGLEGGASFTQDNSYIKTSTKKDSHFLPEGSYTSSTKTGYALVTALGYEIDLGEAGSICPELEFGYRYNPYSKIKLSLNALPQHAFDHNIKSSDKLRSDISQDEMNLYREKSKNPSENSVFKKQIILALDAINRLGNHPITDLQILKTISAPTGDNVEPSELAIISSNKPNSFTNISKALAKAPVAANIKPREGYFFNGPFTTVNRNLLAAMIAGYTADQTVVLAKSLGANIRVPTPKPPKPTNEQEIKRQQFLSFCAADFFLNRMLNSTKGFRDDYTNDQFKSLSHHDKIGIVIGIIESVIYGAGKHRMELIITSEEPSATPLQTTIGNAILQEEKEKMSRIMTLKTFSNPAILDAGFEIVSGHSKDGKRYDHAKDVIAGLLAGFDPHYFAPDSDLDSGYKPTKGDVSDKYKKIADKTSGSLTSTSGMFNLIYNIPIGSKLRPFIGAGIGTVHIVDKMNTNVFGKYNSSDNSMAYQGILGVSYQATPRIKLNTNYRYLATTKKVLRFGFNNKENRLSYNKSYSSQNVLIGISYSFGKLINEDKN